MSRLDELEKLAENISGNTFTNMDCISYFMALTPTTIKEMITLLRQQHEALDGLFKTFKLNGMQGPIAAIYAFKAFDKGE